MPRACIRNACSSMNDVRTYRSEFFARRPLSYPTPCSYPTATSCHSRSLPTARPAQNKSILPSTTTSTRGWCMTFRTANVPHPYSILPRIAALIIAHCGEPRFMMLWASLKFTTASNPALGTSSWYAALTIQVDLCVTRLRPLIYRKARPLQCLCTCRRMALPP